MHREAFLVLQAKVYNRNHNTVSIDDILHFGEV